jgi:hypothetical protein
MKSVLIVVGCDRYDALQPLTGAEADASKVFEALTAAGQRYAPADSQLLLSPSKADFERMLLEVGSGPIDVLTFYFAGHGGVKEGGYYFCLRDSQADRLSLTAYPLNGLLNLVRELRPRFTYLVADSCNSGGTHHDIRDILSDPRLGQDSASTFACLAAAAANQYAQEANGAGLMTAELLKVLDGRLKAGSEQEELDLTEVARVVGLQFEHLDALQRPVAWGLNLFGPGRFCRNPHFAKSETAFHVPEVPVGSELAKQIAARSDQLWELYRGAANGLDYEQVRKLVREVSFGAAVPPADRGSFVFGLARAMAGRLQARGTPWEAAEALGAFATFLLRDVRNDPGVAKIVATLVMQKLEWELKLVVPTLASLGEQPPHLLNPESGMGDYFYLPQRVLKLIATVATATAMAPDFGLVPDATASRALVRKVLENYPLAFKAVCDDQAAALYVWAHFARCLGWQEELEMVFGCLFSDIVATRSKVGRCGLPPKIACEYLLSRGRDWAGLELCWLANPGQLLAVLLLIASEHGFDERVDGHFAPVDHVRLNLYFPRDFATFADRAMEGGVNRTHQIGTDIWRCADFRTLFANHWNRYVASATLPAGPVERALFVCAALVFPDRVPLALQHKTEK